MVYVRLFNLVSPTPDMLMPSQHRWQHCHGKLLLLLPVFLRINKYWRMKRKELSISWLVKPCLVFHSAVCLSGFMHINAYCLEGDGGDGDGKIKRRALLRKALSLSLSGIMA